MISVSSKPHFLLDLCSRLTDIPQVQVTSGAYAQRMGHGKGQKPDHPIVPEPSAENLPTGACLTLVYKDVDRGPPVTVSGSPRQHMFC